MFGQQPEVVYDTKVRLKDPDSGLDVMSIIFSAAVELLILANWWL